MSRHLLQLQHLFDKLQSRYGESDTVVRELGAQLQALETTQAKDSKPHADPLHQQAAIRFRSDRIASSGAPRLL